MADRAGRAGLVRLGALGIAARADTVLVAPVVTEFLQRLRLNGGCLRTSLVLEDSTASGAGVVLVVAVFRAGRFLGVSLGHIVAEGLEHPAVLLNLVGSVFVGEVLAAAGAGPVGLVAGLGAGGSLGIGLGQLMSA